MRTLVVVLFFVSGATGLGLEILWAQYLRLVFGSTAQAHTVVLATFLGGLALGNAALGARADRMDRPVRFYGLLELGIGAFSLTTPWLMQALSSAYHAAALHGGTGSALTALRLVSAAALLLVPSTLMGASLPALARHATRSLAEVEGVVGKLYFANSAGAVAGTLLTGFVLIPAFGLDHATLLAGFASCAVGLLAIAVGFRPSPATQPDPSPVEAPALASPTHVRLIHLAALISGCVALFYEVAYIRLLSLVLGSSTYSFTVMLAAFITGIAVGSRLVARGLWPGVPRYRLYALTQLALGLVLAATLPAYERLPYWFGHLSWALNHQANTFLLYEATKLALCLGLMLPATILLGMALPLASQVVTTRVDRVATSVGRLFAANTLGNVVGAVVAGLWLLPAIGMQSLFELGIVANVAVGTLMLWTAPRQSRRRRLLAFALGWAALLGIDASAGRWDRQQLVRGEFRNQTAHEYPDFAAYRGAMAGVELLFYRDDRDATVTVERDPDNNVFLKVNGKVDASSHGDMDTQLLLGHLPLLLRPGARSAMVIGLGSGSTAGAVLRHPVERLALVEISQAVVDAEKWFRDVNHDPLSDPRTELYIDDAKAVLARGTERYDVIVSEPSNVWIAGVAGLFTVELYAAAAARLAPGGLLLQWLPLYEMDDELVRLVLRSVRTHLPEISLWRVGNDLFIVASRDPLAPRFEAMERALAASPVLFDLDRIGIGRLTTLLSLHAFSPATARQLAGEGPVNSDRHPQLEYDAPRAFYRGNTSTLLWSHDPRRLPGQDEELLLTRHLQTRGEPLTVDELEEIARFHDRIDSGLVHGLLTEWAARAPHSEAALWALASHLIDRGQSEHAAPVLERLVELSPGSRAFLELAARTTHDAFEQRSTYLTGDAPETALRHYDRLLTLHPENPAQVHLSAAQIHAWKGTLRAGIAHLSAATRLVVDGGEPPPDEVWALLADLQRRAGAPEEAARAAQRALEHRPDNVLALSVLDRLGVKPR